jgi:hypothetical protein
MMKVFVYTISCLFAFNSCKKYATIPTVTPAESQIIANHTIIADFDKIPTYYMAEVKKLMVCFPGESHSSAYGKGMELLEASYPAYACNVATGEAYTDQYLRVDAGNRIGEDVWFTWYAYPPGSRPPASNTIKNTIKEYHNQGHPMNVIGFAWCWDLFTRRSRFRLYWDRLTGRVNINPDPVYGVHWRGASVGGPDGNREWGLDAADYVETANRVCTDTYISATEDFIAYCKANGYVTKVVFTTGPADSFTGEAGYQGYLKHQYIRNYVATDSSKILFDYNDILCYDNEGNATTTTWEGHTYPVISPANSGDDGIGHIGQQGAIRLAKAQWWMLARIAGWDGK